MAVQNAPPPGKGAALLPLLLWLAGTVMVAVAAWQYRLLMSPLAWAGGGLAVLSIVGILLLVGRLRAAQRHAEDQNDRLQLVQRDMKRLDEQLAHLSKVDSELVQAKQAAESAMLAKGEFLATMSHEIRTPLNGVLPMLDLLRDEPLTAQQSALVQTAYSSASQMLRIVDDILDYSKLESSKIDLEDAPFNLRQLLDVVMRSMESAAKKKGLKTEVQLDPRVRLAVRGDEVRLRQVISNLLANAIKFTERGGITLAVSRLGESGTAHQLRFEVRDTGIGIPPDVQSRLFDAFTQADASTTRIYGGTGLGLAICKRIITLMGGSIGVDSQPGRGSTFWFEIPLGKIQGDMQGMHATSIKRQVLLLSTDALLRQQLDASLQHWDMQVTAVDTLQGALEWVRDHRRANPVQEPPAVIMHAPRFSPTARLLPQAMGRNADLHASPLVWLLDEPASAPADLINVFSTNVPPVRLKEALEASRPPAPAAASPPAVHGPMPAAADTSSPAPPESAALLRHGHVLLAEDHPVNRMVGKRLIELQGLTCDVVENGREALDAMHRGGYDAVLMDCQMPVLDGYSASRQWRAHETERRDGTRLPIIAMTANVMAGDRQKCLDAGMDDYLPKPVSRDQLRSCLEKWLPHVAVGKRPGSTRTVEPPQIHATADTVLRSLSGTNTPLDVQVLIELEKLVGKDIGVLIHAFINESESALETATRAAAVDDLPTLQRMAHSMKSASANLGAMSLSSEARLIEMQAREEALSHPAFAVQKLTEEFRRAKAELQAWLSQHAGG